MAEKALGQAVFDLYCTDMDRSLRELGFGDLGVPRRMKKMAQAFYGRSATYRQAIAAADQALLAEAISRNVFPENAGQAPALAAYMLRSARLLAAQPMTDIRAAKIAFAPLAASEAA
jgi:cytochrome b pre-mRNA-processing protein 3